MVTGPEEFVEVSGKRGEPRITLLSPTRQTLDALYRVWAKELPNVKMPPEPAPIDFSRGSLDVEALASRVTPEDRAPANGSSIAFLLEHRGASALLTADAFPSVLQRALAALATSRRQPLPWALDLIKLSHHGSRANTTSKLLETVRACHILVSTNGAIFGHPDQEGIARVLASGTPGREVWFNFKTPRTEVWGGQSLQARYGFVARFPAAPGDVTTVQLFAKASSRLVGPRATG